MDCFDLNPIEILVARAKSSGNELEVYKLWQICAFWIDRLVKTNIRNEANADMVIVEIQDKFPKIIKKFEFRSRFKTYLYRIVKNAVADFYRKNPPETKIVSLEEADDITAQQSDRQAEQKEKGRRVLFRLDKELGEVLNLRLLQEKTIKETAELLGKSESTIKRLIYTATLRFRKLY